MKTIYYCPFCDQNSFRRWNLEVHIKRKHGGIGPPIPKMSNQVLQSTGKPRSNNWHTDNYDRSRPPNNIPSNSNESPADLQRFVLESLRNIKEIRDLVSQISIQNPLGFMNAIPTMNFRLASYSTTLGFKGHICEKCLSFEIVPILDDEKMTSLKSNHLCSTQSRDTTGVILYKRKQELIFYLTSIVNNMAKQHELVDLTAVEIPASVFDSRLDSYKEYVDLDSLPSSTPNWAYRAVKERKIVINKTDLAEFLDIFLATLGFFRLTIDGLKCYFFVYVANELDPRDINYLRKLLRTESSRTAEMSVTTNYFAINKEWKDMFIDGPYPSFPALRPDKFGFLFQNPSTAHGLNISNDEWDEIRERQENAYKKNLMQR
jgi:hypothetical protein